MPDDPNAPGPDGTPPMFKLGQAVSDAVRQLEQALLAQADHEIRRVDHELRKAGIDYPTGAVGVRNLAMRDQIAHAGSDLCGHMHTKEGMRGFYWCVLPKAYAHTSHWSPRGNTTWIASD